METATAGPSVQTQSSTQPINRLSPKKSPKKYPRSANSSNNSSPKNSANQPNPRLFQNDINALKRSQNDPNKSSLRSPYEPSSSAIQSHDPAPRVQNIVSTAIENQSRTPRPIKAQETAAASQQAVPVDSLIITVNNSSHRIVQNQPQTILNNVTQLAQNDATTSSKSYLRFSQSAVSRQYQYAGQRGGRRNGSTRPQGRNREAYQQTRPTWRDYRSGGKNYEDDDEIHRKVIVQGFPAYTKAEELVKKLSTLGRFQLETMKNRVAVIFFDSETDASAALKLNNTIPVYGTILSIQKYTTRKHALDLIRSNKKILKPEYKGPPIAAPSEINLSGDFDEQMENIEAAIRLTQEEVHNINLLFEDVETYMRMIYPTCEAVPFGSITTGQGIKSSDADCFLSLSPGTEGRPGPGAAELCSQFVGRAVRLLRLYPEVFKNLVAIPRANTPIIKFLHVPTNVNCDLNSKTPLGVQNSRLLGALLGAAPRLGSAALLLKYWARVAQLSGTGRLTNYALLLLLVFYLQQSVLPPVHKLQGPEHSFIVEYWEAGFDRSPLPLRAPLPPLRDLVGGFFVYYANFDFDDLVVCPLLGRPLRKAEFESGVLPPAFGLYQRNLAGGLALPVRTGCALCVQDPFELSHNVASAVSARLAGDIRAHIRLAAAAYTHKEVKPGDFLRTILFTRPPSPESPEDARLAARLMLPTRLLMELDDDWREILRYTVLNVIYKELLYVELTRRDSVSKEHDGEQESYLGVVKRPVWRRGNNLQARCSAAEQLAWHRASVQRLVRDTPRLPDVHVPIEVELGFRAKPRGFSIVTTALAGADADSFRSFRKFSHIFIHRWHKELLKPHLKVDVPRQEKPNNGENPTSKTSQKLSPKKYNDKPAEANTDRKRSELPPIESVAFVNSNHKDLSESLAAIHLIDRSKLAARNGNGAT